MTSPTEASPKVLQSDRERVDRRRVALYLSLYGILALAPLALLFVPALPVAKGFWTEFSVALGFAGLSLMGAQFIPTARLPIFADTFPSDTLYKHHRQASTLGFLLALAHPVILFASSPTSLALLDITSAPWRARAATVGVVLLIVLVVSSIWRTSMRLRYDVWRRLHTTLTLVVMALFVYHMFAVDRYVANPAMRAYWIIMIVIWALSVGYSRLVRPLDLARRPWRVVEVRPELGNTNTVVLEPVRHRGLSFMAGQFGWLSVGKSPYTLSDNPFSFGSSAETSGRLEFAIREAGDFTSSVPQLEVGALAYVDGPFGTFDLDQHTGPGYAFIGGGSGIVPIVSILRTMADRDDQTPAVLFYGNPDWESVTFREELDSLAGRLDLEIVHVLSIPPEGWTGETGFIDREILDRHLPAVRRNLQYFICGPGPMIDAVEHALHELEIPLGRVHSENYKMA